MEVILREILGGSVQAGHFKNAEQPGAILVLLFGVVRALDFVHDTLLVMVISPNWLLISTWSEIHSSPPWIHRSFCNVVYFRHTLVLVSSRFVCTTSVRFLSISSVAHLEWFRIAMTISKQWEFCISFLRSVEVWYRRKWATERAGHAKFANILAALDWTAGIFLVSECENQCSFSMLFGLPPNGVMSLCERVLQRVFSLSKTRGCKFCQGVCWRLPSELQSEKWTWNVSKERQPSPDVHDLNLEVKALTTYLKMLFGKVAPAFVTHGNGLNQFFSRTCWSISINSGQEHLGPAAQWQGYWGRSCHAFVRLCMQSFRACCHDMSSVVLSCPV